MLSAAQLASNCDKNLLTDAAKQRLSEDIKSKLSGLLEVECDNVLSVGGLVQATRKIP